MSRYVSCLYALRVDRDAARASWQHVTPDGEVELNFPLGAPLLRCDADGTQELLSQPYLLARLSEPYKLKRTGPSHVLGVRFRPGGFTALTGVPANQLADRVASAADVLGQDLLDLHDRLKNSDQPFSHTEAWLMARSTDRRAVHPGVERALSRIHSTQGNLSMKALASDALLGLRRLEQHFSACIGASPKAYSRLVRFQSALKELRRDRCDDLMDTTVACGYYDPPHLIREFKAFAGMTPEEYRTGTHPLNDLMHQQG